MGGLTVSVKEEGALALARERFLMAEDFDPDAVRDPIEASWRRSRFWGVDVDQTEIPYREDIDRESRLVHAAQPVMDRLEVELSDAKMTAILTDAQAFVLDRRAGEPSLNSYLDSVLLAPGFTYAEKFIGTNGIGTALEEKRPFHVFGHEHFVESLQTLSCAGSPIRDPLTGRLLGILDLTCWEPNASLLMKALVTEAALDIEGRLFEQSCERERALLQEFLAACRRTKKAVLSLSHDLIITNVGASHLLDHDDHTIIREAAAELTSPRREMTGEVMLSRGALAHLRCRPVVGDFGLAGTIVEIDLSDADGGEPRARSTTPSAVPLPGLAGSSPAWVRVCQQVEAHRRRNSWPVLVGEPGVGKQALARGAQQRVHPTASLTTIDADDCPESGIGAWAAPIRGPDPEPNRAVVVLHLDRLSAAAGAELAEQLAAARDQEPRPWIVGTLDADTVAGQELDLVLQEFETSITVPPLRHRITDVHDLVPALVERHAPNTGVECDPDVMQTLLRRDWLGNVAELEETLRAALARRRVGHIRLEDLPEELHATSPRVLTRWEALERDAIVRALIEAEGNRTEAAARLSISRATIYRKIRAYGILIEGHEK
jgi:transcriptional regulator of acetoin/glycerol metabolism